MVARSKVAERVPKSRTDGARASNSRRLRSENAALKKTIAALAARVEHSLDEDGTPFSWFQAAAKLEETVRLRTSEYEAVNSRLQRELESRRMMELALKSAKLQAELANRSKTRFLAAASHDLRQPLSSAMLFLESIEEQSLGHADLALLSRSRVALASLNNLLGTLLDIAQLDSAGIVPQPTDFPINALLGTIGPEFRSVANSAGLDLRVMPCSVNIRTDIHLLETILRNFITNAIRYTVNGRILVGCRRRSDGLMICVLDTGVGIASGQLEAIFREYYRISGGKGARARGNGIGLGLSIVSRIVQLLDLKRAVRSVPGRGSMFAVVAPYGRATTLSATSPPSHVIARSRRLKIVVIDDNHDVLTGMAAVLEKWGCQPITGTSAMAVIENLIESDIVPDLILSDYYLGDGMTGDRAIAQLQAHFDRTLRAAIITSHPDPDLRKRLWRKGLTILDKPINFAQLRAILDHLPD